MTISLPISLTMRKDLEKTIEVRLPSLPDKLNVNKVIQAFLTVLRSPVE